MRIGPQRQSPGRLCLCEASELVKKCGCLAGRIQPRNKRARIALVANLGDQLLESLDRAASAHARMDRIAAGAQALVLELEIEAAIEIERGAILVKLCAHAPSAEDEVDLLQA